MRPVLLQLGLVIPIQEQPRHRRSGQQIPVLTERAVAYFSSRLVVGIIDMLLSIGQVRD